MRISRVLGGLAVLAVGSVNAARADFRDFANRCSSGAVRACASIQLLTTDNSSGGTDVVIRIQNMQGWGPAFLNDNTGGSMLVRLGIVTPQIAGVTGGLSINAVGGATTVGNPASGWSLRTPSRLGGPMELTAGTSNFMGIRGCDASRSPSSNYFTTCGGGWIEFSFSTTNQWSASSAEVAWLTSDVVAPVLDDVLPCDSDQPINGIERNYCAEVTATPEPVTMILLGSGLAGMGGFGFVRRRKNEDSAEING